MDYDYPLTGHPAVQPRHYYWESRVDYKGTTTYGFTGAGSDMEGFIFGDGVNEHGLAISNQYDRGYAHTLIKYTMDTSIFHKLKY